MIKILAILPSKTDSCSFYRGATPLKWLHKLEDRIDVKVQTFDTPITYADLMGVDICFVQRPIDSGLSKAFDMIKNNNIKLWFDYDDLFTDIPVSNDVTACKDEDSYHIEHKMAIRTQHKEEMKKGFIDCVEYADIVTTSTKYLANEIKKYNENCFVVENAFNNYVFPLHKRSPFGKPFGIIWRGTATHKADLYKFSKHIKTAFEKTAPCPWFFLGYNPAMITNQMSVDRTMIQKSIDPISYHHDLIKIQACSFIVPLEDTPFNRAKSSIAAIEASWSGASPIVPNWQEWGGFSRRYNTLDEFMELCIVPPTLNEIRSDWDYVIKNLLLSNINKKRLNVIDSLLGN